MKRNTMKKRIGNESRHYCVHCGTKLYASDMVQLRIPLIKKDVWSCELCLCSNVLSSAEDKNQISKNLILLISYRLEK